MSNIENKNVSKDVIYDENNGLFYTQIGDYYYPNIAVENTEKVPLGKYGRARLRYLKEHKKGLYTELLMTGKLTEHLKEIDLNSKQKVHSIIQDMAKKDGIPVYFDDTKIEQLEWVKYMNELSRQAVLLSENKIGSLDDLNAFRTKLEDEVRTLKGTRENLQRKKRKSTKQEDINKFDEEFKILAPKIKQLNMDIQNCYKIEKRTILWQQEYDKAMKKEQEQQKQNELKQSKKKLRKYLR